MIRRRSALEPRLDWGEAERLAVEVEYLRAFGYLLDKGDSCELSWPPRGRLVHEGMAWTTTPECSVHGEVLSRTCAECGALPPPQTEFRPAQWEWHVTVETLDEELVPVGGPDRHEILVTEVHPLEVEFY